VGRPFIDLTGQRFDGLLILHRVGINKHGSMDWLVRCIVEWCGNEKVISISRLTDKRYPMEHCGCLTKKHRADAGKIYSGAKASGYKHGRSRTKEYRNEKKYIRRIKKSNNNSGFTFSYFGSPEKPKLDYCVYCGSIDKFTVDHIIPITKGGNNNPENLITACMSCNISKHASFFIDWYIKSKRVTRSLTEIIADMGFDSIFHLQHYQDSMCPDHYEKNRSSVVAKILRAKVKNNKLLNCFYKSLDNYPTH